VTQHAPALSVAITDGKPQRARAGYPLLKPFSGLNVDVGYVTQSGNSFPWQTVLENGCFGLS
jgi:hypothetical protein